MLAAALLGKNVLRYFIYRAKRLAGAAVMAKPVPKTRYYVGLTIALVSVLPFYLYGVAARPVGAARRDRVRQR